MLLRKYIGERSFYYRVLSIAMPLVLQQLVTGSVNLISNLMVGQVVVENAEKGVALAGVVAVNRLYNIALFGLFGTMAACTLYIAQFFGAKDENHMKQAFRFGLVVNLAIGLIFCLAALLFPAGLLRFFTPNAQIIEQGTKFLFFTALSLLPMSLSISISDAMRAIGDVKTPLLASAAAVVSTITLNYLLILGNLGFPQLGVTGAGISLLIARCLELGVLLVKLSRSQYGFKTELGAIFEVEWPLAKEIVKKGLPLLINEVFWSLGITMLFKFYATRGTEVMVGYGITQSVNDMFFVLFNGMAAATTIIISHSLGAGRLKEAKEDAYRLLAFSMFLSVCFAVIMIWTSFFIPHWFDVTEGAKTLAVTFIRVSAFMFWIYMCSAECYFILRAGGDTISTLLMDSCYMWGVNIVVVGLLTYYTDLNILQLYLCGQATDLLKMAISVYLVRRGKWIVNLTENKGLTGEY